MISKKRLILYIIAFFFLVLTAGLVIFAANGYYFDFKEKKIKKHGMIVVRSIPKNVNVFLDNNFKKNKTPINISTLPGSYNLKIEKDGYVTWQKQISVDSGLATWVDYIFLIPKDKKITPITTEGIKSFQISHDESRVAFVDLKNNIWTANLNNNEQKKIYSSEIYEKEIEILDWSSNDKNLLIKTTEENNKNYKLIKENETALFNNMPEMEKIEFAENSDERFLGLSGSRLYAIGGQENPIIEEGVSTFAQSQNNLFFVKNNGQENDIFKASFDLKTKDKLQTEKNQKITLFPGKNQKLVYTTGTDNELFLLNDNKEKIGSNVLDVSWAKDDKKINYKTPNEIHVYTLETDDPKEPKNRITTRLSVPIDKCIWFFDSKHIIFKSEKTISLIELDGENSTPLTDSAAQLNIFKTTKQGKTLIFAEEKDGIKNIKTIKLLDN